MALHDPAEDARRAQEVPEGAIGTAIDDKQPSRTRQFLTDPKNLATLLVLASALAQPNRSGRSDVGHALRGGVGALAFRGGLNESIEEQRQASSEATSIIQNREELQRLSGERNVVAGEQVEATTRGQDVGAEQRRLDRLSAERIAEGRVEALSSREVLENELIKIGLQGYHKAYSDWLLSGGVGSPPDPLSFVPLPEGMSIGPLESGAEVIIPGPNPPPSTTLPPPPREEAVPFAPTLVAGVPVTGRMSRSFRADIDTKSVRDTMLRVARGRYPEVYKEASDDEIFARITSIQQDIKASLDAGMSQADAQALRGDKFMIEHMTREQRSEVLSIARGLGKIPKINIGL